MFIMPKGSSILEQTLPLKNYINKYKRLEIQFFRKNEGECTFNFEDTVRKDVKEFDLKEITIHPPLEKFEIEYLLFRDKELVFENVRKAIKLSNELNIKINLLYHCRWDIEFLKYAVTPIMKEILEIIGDNNITILLENSTMVAERKHCSVLDFCEYIDNPKLRFCLDICHVYCLANMYKSDIYNWINQYIDKEKSAKYLYQVHFSYTAKNDGYIDKKTHGVVHPNFEELAKDMRILKDYAGFNENVILVTEISEVDYNTRKDQLQEIEWVQKL